MYHSIDVPPLFHGWRGLYVTPQLLARQIRELQKDSTIHFSTLTEWNEQRLSGRQVALTFDDAYRSLFVNGLPVLQKAGARAITYVVASLIGKSNEWDNGKGIRHELLMDRAQLKEWIAAGHEIGAHTLTHPLLTKLSLDEARREIIDSKKMLEDIFGQPIRHFCYPYGGRNEALAEMVREAGYETATGPVPGVNAATTDALALRRIMACHERPYLAALMRR